MKKVVTYNNTVLLFLLISVCSLAFKTVQVAKHYDPFFAQTKFDISYQFFIKTNDEAADIKTYLPKNNHRQRITKTVNKGDIKMIPHAESNNLQGIWKTKEQNVYKNFEHTFTFEGKTISYSIPTNFDPITKNKKYLKESGVIQSKHPRITKIKDSIKNATTTDDQLLQGIYNYALAVPKAPVVTLTDAITVLNQNLASCNGKSRLFIALCQNAGFPARMVGGIILEETNKRTSHAWTEVFINGNWIPFDTLNDHYASIPATYLELHKGDRPLITYTPSITMDYNYEIKERTNIPFLKLNASQFNEISPVSLWELVDKKIISTNTLMLLLMLPIGGLLVAFLRNVVGLRTFGVFLPVLIAFSLVETGFAIGLLLFLLLILFVGLISRPFHQLGLLHTPKLVISLTLMVLIMIFGSYMGLKHDILWLTSLTIFPTIILTVSAERFSTLIVEDGFEKAIGTLFQTLIAVCFCYLLLSSQYMKFVLMLFPEILFVIICIALLLGRYIGLRWTELLRFKPLLQFKNSELS